MEKTNAGTGERTDAGQEDCSFRLDGQERPHGRDLSKAKKREK